MSKSAAIVRRITQALPTVLGIVVFAFSIGAIHQELQHYRLQDILSSLAAIPVRYLLLAIGLTGLNYLAITGYDTLAMRYVGQFLAYRKSAFASATSTAVSNGIGFALLSGSAIRYRLYLAWGLSIAQIAQVIAFSTISFWLGLFSTAGVIFWVQPVLIPAALHLPVQSTRSLGVLFLAIIVFHLLWNLIGRKPIRIGGWTLPHVPPRIVIAQIAVASADWTIASTVLYALLQPNTTLPYANFFAVYLLAQFAGAVSSVPGGLGVFETVMLLMLTRSPQAGIASTTLFGALLAYRSIYYLLPLVVAALLLGRYELRRRFT